MLINVFCMLKALSEYYKTAHWQVKNTIYYADHTLLDRLHEEADARIDQIAEKHIGTGGNVAELNLNSVLKKEYDLIKNLPYVPEENTAFFQAALEIENKLLEVCEAVNSSAEASVGVKNLIGDIADEAEGRVYLIRQRLNIKK